MIYLSPEILKSPFFNLDDDALYEIAYGRDGPLWQAMKNSAQDNSTLQDVCTEIEESRKIALSQGAFAFFNHLLQSGSPSGRQRLYKRLSEASREPIDEFLRISLEYERSNPKSLQDFVVWAENNVGEIKREQEQGSEAVRILTVHGAKGLEGEIVFLLDTHKVPNTRGSDKIDVTAPDTSLEIKIPMIGRDTKLLPEPLKAAKDRANILRYEEYRRLLYVAATRARDRLYICGLENKNTSGKPKETSIATWYALAENAFDQLGDVQIETFEHWPGTQKIYRV